MKILVISDTHKNTECIMRAVRNNPDIGYIFHLGDHDTDLDVVRAEYPDKQYYCVCGNNDYGCFSPTFGVVTLNSRTIFYTHGHLYGVNSSMRRLAMEAKKYNAEIALFGHTHIPYADVVESVHVFNPGSPSKPLGGSEASYGIIELGEEMLFIHKSI